MTRVVLFDLYQTLLRGGSMAELDSNSGVMAEALGVDRARFVELWRSTTSARWRGELGTLSEALRTMACRLGGNPTSAALRFAEVTRLRQCREWLWPPATVLETLDQLRQAGMRLGLVSNCSPETVTLWPGQPLAQLFDAVGFSCVIGVAKPDPTIFLKVCSDLGVAPQTCVFVGDGGSDELAAATTLGMRAIRTRQFADNDPGWTGPEITDLRQLPRLLGV